MEKEEEEEEAGEENEAPGWREKKKKKKEEEEEEKARGCSNMAQGQGKNERTNRDTFKFFPFVFLILYVTLQAKVFQKRKKK